MVIEPVELKFPNPNEKDERLEVTALLSNLKANLPELQRLLGGSAGFGEYEDGIYRFYHQSWKVYPLQKATEEIVKTLQSMSPDRPLNEWFMRIVREGTGKRFEVNHNRRWLEVTRPILEAYFHARYFLEMAVKYGKGLEFPPLWLPSGWASLLYLYGLR